MRQSHYCSVLRCIVVYESNKACDTHHLMLQCVAVCCSVLQCVAVCCSVLQCDAHHLMSAALCYHLVSAAVSAMGWLQLVGSLKLQVSFAEYRLFYRALLQKRPIILRSLRIEATPYHRVSTAVSAMGWLRFVGSLK